MEAPAVEPPKEMTMLERVRNMWEFANLGQWIFIFGNAVKIDENLDIEVREPRRERILSIACRINDTDDGDVGSRDGMSQKHLYCSS